MPIKYYTCFGLQNRAVDVLLHTVNPVPNDIAAAQIRPYDGGANPMFIMYGTVDSFCDITWALRANKEVYHPLKVTPSALAIIRSEQLRTVLDGVPYRGNRIYLVSLNAPPLIYADRENLSIAIREDISNEYLQPYLREFLPGAIETFDPANMTKIFIQHDHNQAYTASEVRGWVDDGNVFVNMFGAYRKYNGGGEVTSSVGLTPGNLIRVKKDDTCLRPLVGGATPTEYALTRSITAYYWSTLPAVAGWTTNVILAYVKNATEYPFVIEMVHDASGGVLLSLACYNTISVLMPGWWYPIVFLQYPLGKAGYLGAVPSYVQE